MTRLTRVRFGMILLLAGGMLSFTGCQAVKDAVSGLNSLKKLQFKLGDVNGFKLAGVDISRMNSASDIGVMDVAKLTSAVASKKLPVDFTLNVLAKNPNDGSGSTKSTSLLIKKMAWTLSIDNRSTINGIVDNISIPGNGQTTTIPVSIGLDLMKFFGDKGYNDIANLAMAIGGASGSSSRLKLTAKVTVGTPFGDYTYPDELTIVNTQFTNQ